MGHVGSKLCHKVKSCVRSRGHIFSQILMKLGQIGCLDRISYNFENGLCGVKNRVTRSKLRKTFCSRGHIFSLILMKLGENVCLNKISDIFEYGSCGVRD